MARRQRTTAVVLDTTSLAMTVQKMTPADKPRWVNLSPPPGVSPDIGQKMPTPQRPQIPQRSRT